MAIAKSKLVFPGGWGTLALTAAALVAASCIPGSGRNGPLPVRAGPTRMIGTLVVDAAPGENRARAGPIALPDARVFLMNAENGRVAEALTRLDGRFEIVAPAPGRYRLCYEIGAARGCGPQVAARGDTLPIGLIAVAAQAFIHGRVLTGDGRPCWVSDSFFGLDVSTQVSAAPAVGGGPPQASARANTRGDYVLFGLSPNRYRVTAECEAATVTDLASLGGGPVARDLTLPNHAPVLRTAAAFSGPRGLARAAPGATVDLRSDAIDRDGDTIEYLWRTLDGNGQIVGAGAAPRWQLPAAEGLRSVYLIARDRRGGFAYRRIDVEGTRNDRVMASGRVIDEATGAPVNGAAVTFGSARGETDANGLFQVESERRDDTRYVLNIRHRDYALTSRVLERSARGQSYEMVPVDVGSAPAGEPMRLVDRSSGSLCGNPVFRREAAMVRRAELELPSLPADRGGYYQQSAERRRAQARATEPRCLSRGSEIRLRPGALVDDRDRAATGMVRTSVATLNPARRALPGDYSALPRGRGPSALLSYGAVDVRFTDASGAPLKLRDGETAEIRMPVEPGQVAGAPATMKMWSYNETDGRWVEEGIARLEQTAEGAFYVGRTSHFSAINMDIELNLPSATCVKFTVDPLFSPWAPLTLRAYVTYGGTSSQAQETVLDAGPDHSIRAVPYAPGNTLRLQLRGTLNGSPQVLLDRIIPLGPPRPQMNTVLFPPPPYAECDDVGQLSPAQGVLPDYGDFDATGRPAFLSGPSGSFNEPDPDTAAYYARLDATGTPPPSGVSRETLGGWWGTNGFDSATGESLGGVIDANTAYTNYNDLGFGRDMHCLERSGNRLACYVTNYGLPDQSASNAQAAADHNVALRGATVTMEYEPTLGANAVRFYVYGGGVAGSTRINYADLDGLGPKPVPYLCTVCHGGNYQEGATATSAAHDVADARFREFDLPTFLYPGGATFNADFSGHTLPPTAITAFGRLNQMVRNAQPLIDGGVASTPIRALIDLWYPTGFTVAPVQPAVPSAWIGNEAAYRVFYAPSCRACHIARDAGNSNAFLVFNNPANFNVSFVRNAVCGNTSVPAADRRRVMPNAYVTYRNFWVDTARLPYFQALSGATNCGS